MPHARTQQPPASLTPYVLVIAVIVATVVAALRYPGVVALWVGVVVSAFFTVAPLFTGQKDTNGTPTVNGPGEARKMQQHRMWSELRWKLILPGIDWLPNAPRQLREWLPSTNPQGPALALIGRSPRAAAALSKVRPLVYVLATVTAVAWLVLPTRFVTVAAYGAAAAAFTLPTDALGLNWAWANTAAAYVLVTQVDMSMRRHIDADDPSDGVRISVLARRLREGGWAAAVPAIGALVGAAALTAGLLINLHLAGVAWLFAPDWLLGVGVTAAIAAGFLHLLVRREALTSWRQTKAARAAWKPRWAGLKLSPAPYLISHTRVGEACTTVDTFEAPGTLGAAGAIALHQKLMPMMGSGVRFAMLPAPDIDGDGQPIEGSRHPLRFRVITWQQSTLPDATDPNVDRDELALFLETVVYNAVLEAKQWQPILLGVDPIFRQEGSQPTAAWASVWVSPDGTAANSLSAVRGTVSAVLQTEAYVDDPDGIATLYLGAVKAPTTTLRDPGLLAHMEQLEVTARWGQRWADALKLGEKPPVIQHAVYKEAALADGTVIHCQPFMVKQGLDPTAFFGQEMRKKLATTLAAAPFVTVTGFVVAGYREGERHTQGLSVIWSNGQVPSNPANINPGGSSFATRWALAGAINDAFDAAKLVRPEVSSVRPLTDRDDSIGHIWQINLRLYGGVTSAAVKLAQEKIRMSLGCDWLRLTEIEDGVAIYAGASPKFPTVVFARTGRSNSTQNRDKTISLDWEQAFLDAKVASKVDGTAPKLLKSGVLPSNDKVQVLEFSLPRGVNRGEVKEAVSKLVGLTGNEYIEVRAGSTPSSFTLLVCEFNPMPFPARFNWDAVAASKALPFATNVEGAPVEIDIMADPHLLVLGGTGSGKSAALQVLLTLALLRGWEVFLADPMKLAADFRYGEPWMRAIAIDEGSTSAMMNLIFAEVDRRRQLNGRYGVASYRDLPEDVRPAHVMVIIDEFTSLMAAETLRKPGADATEDELRDYEVLSSINDAKKNIGAKAARTVREARSTGFTLILAAQELKAETLKAIPGGTSLKNNMSSLILGKASFGSLMSALKAPTEAPDLGEVVPTGRGIYESSKSKPFAVQAWYDNNHVESMVSHITAVRAPLDPSKKADLAPYLPTTGGGPVFGEIIDDTEAPHDDTVIDMGELDLSFDFGGGDDDGLGIDFDALPADAADGTSDKTSEPDVPADAFLADDGDAPGATIEASTFDTDTIAFDDEPLEFDIDAIDMPDTVEAPPAAAGGKPPAGPRSYGDRVLFLDVDRTVSPIVRSDDWHDFRTIADVPGGAAWISDTMLGRLGDLPATVVWLSDWEAEAGPALNEPLGQPAHSLTRNDADEDLGWWKVGAVARFLREHPQVTSFAVADDHLGTLDDLGISRGDLIADVARQSGARVALITPEDGLTSSDVERLAAFFDGQDPEPASAAQTAPALDQPVVDFDTAPPAVQAPVVDLDLFRTPTIPTVTAPAVSFD
ncbi:type IV secretory system conjugative DNA transfer family protein [Rathayibacter iranicus]|uniref:FtsK domain-containing protein n=2 Tax=Rathayibacter iranicus TaxID=59737 RepID=A0AAD1ACI3_9MICO|nr:FtsK/SpoIIIE domain-containing protein [Rathayibacter iranicus]AZZ54922.1 hypothetical protein C7V51_02760 [Rathayibacter iranicus]MWV32481.1 hypothetical protein [Rathayibacter iranicus NCPPB 2253 = VKM Ac-1602]PPI62543.1 hypothetical protein C5E08_02770 [Rathayibacter iranicus]PWJ61218.1 FtsK/SpoIIIE family protein [Rathayibacter iranicus NCPPB 2253 = VKM Ac-1602]